MLKLILFYNLIQISLADFFENCDTKFDVDSCIENVFCAWCNVTKFLNNTYITNESCIFKNTCTERFNDTNCMVNPNRYKICGFTGSTVNLLIIFIYMAIAYTLIISTRNLYEYKKYPNCNFFIDLFITLIVFIPSFILWFIESSYFLPYLLALLTTTFIVSVFSATYKCKKKNDIYHGYQQIN